MELSTLLGLSAFNLLLSIVVAVSIVSLLLLGKTGHNRPPVEIGIWIGLAVIFVISLTFCRWAKGMPRLTLDLGSYNPEKAQAAWKKVQEMGEKAIPYLKQVFSLPYTDTIYDFWKGQEAWKRTVEWLGRWKAREAIPELPEALNEPDAELRAITLWALGEIGDLQVIPTIIPLLGDLRWVQVEWTGEPPENSCNRRRVSDWAAETLDKLGEGELANAFRAVLNERDREALEILQAHPQRKAIVAGLMAALDYHGEALAEAANAAWVLGELTAVEALPKLRRKTSLLYPERLRQTCQEAIAKLEPLRSLPRAVAPMGIDTSQLPRPADPTAIIPETLPRSASQQKEERG